MDVIERVIFSDIVTNSDSFRLQGGYYRIGAVIIGTNNVQLQTIGPDGKTWIDCLDIPIAASRISEEISIVPGVYRFHLSTSNPVSAVMTSILT